MKYLLITLFAACSTYKGVVVNKGRNRSDLEVKVDEYYYIMPLVTFDQYDSLKIGDTLRIRKSDLRIVK